VQRSNRAASFARVTLPEDLSRSVLIRSREGADAENHGRAKRAVTAPGHKRGRSPRRSDARRGRVFRPVIAGYGTARCQMQERQFRSFVNARPPRPEKPAGVGDRAGARARLEFPSLEATIRLQRCEGPARSGDGLHPPTTAAICLRSSVRTVRIPKRVLFIRAPADTRRHRVL